MSAPPRAFNVSVVLRRPRRETKIERERLLLGPAILTAIVTCAQFPPVAGVIPRVSPSPRPNLASLCRSNSAMRKFGVDQSNQSTARHLKKGVLEDRGFATTYS